MPKLNAINRSSLRLKETRIEHNSEKSPKCLVREREQQKEGRRAVKCTPLHVRDIVARACFYNFRFTLTLATLNFDSEPIFHFKRGLELFEYTEHTK
jgi:hypothetical protein